MTTRPRLALIALLLCSMTLIAERTKLRPGTNRFSPQEDIEIGKEADIAVWEQDLIRSRVNVLKDLKCVLTLLKGNIVYRDTQRLP